MKMGTVHLTETLFHPVVTTTNLIAIIALRLLKVAVAIRAVVTIPVIYTALVTVI
jgi:hypothetical protein